MLKKVISLVSVSIFAVVLFISPVINVGAADSALTLVAQYKFEDSKNLGLDTSGHNNNLTAVGTVKQGTGIFGGKSLELNADGALAASVDENGKDFFDKLDGNVTISFFSQNHDVDIPNGDGAGQRWLSNGQWGAGSSGIALATRNYANDGGKARPMFMYLNNYAEGENNWCGSLDYNKFPCLVWDHILVVIDKTNNKIMWYYNTYLGLKSGEKSLTSIDFADTSFAFAIGGVVANDLAAIAGEPYKGCIDEFSIYKGIPSDKEISNLNNYGTIESTSKNSNSDLAVYYSFNDPEYIGKQDDGYYSQPLQSRIGTVTSTDGPTGHGKAAHFDGKTSLTALSGFDVIDALCFAGGSEDSYTNKMTVAFSFKSESGGRMFHAGAAGGNGFTINDNLDGDGKLVTSTCDDWHVNEQLVNDGKWHQVVWSFDRKAFNAIVYLDNVKIYETDVQGTALTTPDTAMRLGGSAWDWGDPEGGLEFYTGSIDDLYIYNKALTATDVENLWKGSGIPVIESEDKKPGEDANKDNKNPDTKSDKDDVLETIPKTGEEVAVLFVLVLSLASLTIVSVSRKLKG